MSLASRQIRHLTFLSCRHVLHKGFSVAKAPSLYLNTISIWVNTARVGVGTISLVFCLTAHLRSVEVVQAPQTAGVLDSGVPLHLVSCFFLLPSFAVFQTSAMLWNPGTAVCIHKYDVHAWSPLYLLEKLLCIDQRYLTGKRIWHLTYLMYLAYKALKQHMKIYYRSGIIKVYWWGKLFSFLLDSSIVIVYFFNSIFSSITVLTSIV